MKKFMSLLLSFATLLSLSISAFAAETETPAYVVTVSEYDVYVSIRTKSSAELAKSGVSSQQASIIKSNRIENELLYLSSLSKEELATLGYTDYQINLLQDYNGERIETNPELRGIFADMTAEFYKKSASSSLLSIRVDWKWSNPPVLSGFAITDLVAIRWQGTNNAGAPINLAFNSSKSSCTVYYYDRAERFETSKKINVICDSPYDHAYCEIPMGIKGNYDELPYAKKGSFTLAIERTGSDLINEAAFVFGYGHTVLNISPSLSLPPSFGIGFSSGIEKMVEEAIRMDRNGKITEY